MSTWVYALLYMIAIFTISQTLHGVRRHRAGLKERLPLQNVKDALGYNVDTLQSEKHRSPPSNVRTRQQFHLLEPDMFLELLNNLSILEYHRNAIDQWNFESNITKHTRKIALRSSERLAQFQRSAWKAAMQYDWNNLNDSTNWKRQFEMLSVLGDAALPVKEFRQLDEIINDMESIYSTATITPYRNDDTKIEILVKDKSNKIVKARRRSCEKNTIENAITVNDPLDRNDNLPRGNATVLRLEPDLIKIMAESDDPEELQYVWKAWRDATGKKMKQKYVTYVRLMQKVATLNNFPSAGKYWTHPYEDHNFEKTIAQMWKEIKPLYLQLHAYVRSQLRRKYGPQRVQNDSYIPAHLLGDMWAQSWTHLRRFAMPYPKLAKLDLTSALIEKNFTAIDFFKLAENFFHSIGFPMLPSTFWNRSILVRPEDKRELVCHGSAWDMYDGKDFRIKMCTRVTYEDLVIVHHEMGHVYYFMQYKDQPIIFQEGANPGFHEAIGDTIALSVSSPPHTSTLGLTKSTNYDAREDINFLFTIALQKVAFLPFAYCVDKWRWSIFNGDVKPENYNDLWWMIRAELQGIEPPVDRNRDDFDPGAKYHIAANVPYIRYFVSFVIQFQFLEAVCLSSGRYDPGDKQRPLHRCDIYGSLEAGLALRQMMKLGSSKPWPDAMEILTGHRSMQTKGLHVGTVRVQGYLAILSNLKTREPCSIYENVIKYRIESKLFPLSFLRSWRKELALIAKAPATLLRQLPTLQNAKVPSYTCSWIHER